MAYSTYIPRDPQTPAELFFAGGVGWPEGPLKYLGPEIISPERTTFRWDTSGIVADEYRLTLGTSPLGTDTYDSGVFVSNNAFLSWFVTNIPEISLYLTIWARFDSGPWTTYQRLFRIEQELGMPSADGLWHDELPWNDELPWIE